VGIKNNPKFTVTVLGSGSCVPLKDRYPSSYFICPRLIPSGWLVDVGSGAIQRLIEVGESCLDIESVFISHVHPDHISDLLPLLQALNYTPNFKRTKPFYIYGSKDIKRYLDFNLELALPLTVDFPLEFILLKDKMKFEREGWSLEVRHLKHSAKTLGFRWNLEGCILVYGADTGPCEGISKLAKGADLLILESSFLKDNPKPHHLTTYQAGEIAKNAGAKKLLLSHFYPEVLEIKKEDKEKEVRGSGYNGEIIFAEDLMSISGCS
jgi:ribonuclease BN (tRNA processing enzyme)